MTRIPTMPWVVVKATKESAAGEMASETYSPRRGSPWQRPSPLLAARASG